MDPFDVKVEPRIGLTFIENQNDIFLPAKNLNINDFNLLEIVSKYSLINTEDWFFKNFIQ